MKFLKPSIFSFWAVLMVFGFACSNKKDSSSVNSYKYIPDDQKLYETIVRLDSIFFEAYNTCNVNLDKYASFYSDSVEFYHDKGGVMTSKQNIVEATKKNICGKVTRELVNGSIEVYPIYNYGAVEIGLHKFHNHEEKQPGPAKISKFYYYLAKSKQSMENYKSNQPSLIFGVYFSLHVSPSLCALAVISASN